MDLPEFESIIWVGTQFEEFYSQIKTGYTKNLPNLEKLHHIFESNLCNKSLNRKSLLPVSIDILSSFLKDQLTFYNTKYHREHDTFDFYNKSDPDNLQWYLYKIDDNRFDKVNINTPRQFSTNITYNNASFSFYGHSLFSCIPLENIPPYNNYGGIKLLRLKLPDYFIIEDLKLIQNYLIGSILGLPLDTLPPYFYVFPLFTNFSSNNAFNYVKNICSFNILTPLEVLAGFLNNSKLIHTKNDATLKELVINLENDPSTLRIDDFSQENFLHYSKISFDNENILIKMENELAENWANYLIEYHQKNNKSNSDRLSLQKVKISNLKYSKNEMTQSTIEISFKGYRFTRIFTDLTESLSHIFSIIHHIRFHISLQYLDQYLGYKFKNRILLESCLIHSSYQRNSSNLSFPPSFLNILLDNVGPIDSKRDLKVLANNQDKPRIYDNNEKLEFLGDAVIEFITTLPLFHIFPDVTEGHLAIFRSSIVQNCHLTVLAKQLHLLDFILYIPTIRRVDTNLHKDALLANAFEALLGGIFVDSNWKACHQIFSKILWSDNPILSDLWFNYPEYSVITWSKSCNKTHTTEKVPLFKTLTKFEESIGISFEYKHLLAKAFCQPSIKFNKYTCGSNRTLEFLGDAILQFIVSNYLFHNYNDCEGVLTALRASIVNNNTLSQVAHTIGLHNYILMRDKSQINYKILADVFESLIASIFLEKDLIMTEVFLKVLLFPQLNYQKNQFLTDPKHKLSNICKRYYPNENVKFRILKKEGPINKQTFIVAAYVGKFKLAHGVGLSKKTAESRAAINAVHNLNTKLSRKRT